MDCLASFPSPKLSPVVQLARPQGCRLRPARDRDVPFLKRLYRHSRDAEFAHSNWSPEQKAAFCDMQFTFQHADWLRRFENGWFLVVTQRSAPIGRLYLDMGQDEARVVDITLLPEWRGKGIGAALLTMAAQWAAPRPLALQVDEINPAWRLYTRLGFVEQGRQGGRVQMTLNPAAL